MFAYDEGIHEMKRLKCFISEHIFLATAEL